MKRVHLKARKKLLEKMPYSKNQLNELTISDLKILASVLGIDSWHKTKDYLVKSILRDQHELELIDERLEDFCEMCGNFVAIRQDSHIVSEKGRARINILKLCPSCHVMFDTRLKPRLYEALKDAGAKNLPKSWTKSIYHQAIEAAMKSRRRNLKAKSNA